jgi:hypothetical protein
MNQWLMQRNFTPCWKLLTILSAATKNSVLNLPQQRRHKCLLVILNVTTKDWQRCYKGLWGISYVY